MGDGEREIYFRFQFEVLTHAESQNISNKQIFAINIMDESQYSTLSSIRKPQLHEDRYAITCCCW